MDISFASAVILLTAALIAALGVAIVVFGLRIAAETYDLRRELAGIKKILSTVLNNDVLRDVVQSGVANGLREYYRWERRRQSELREAAAHGISPDDPDMEGRLDHLK